MGAGQKHGRQEQQPFLSFMQQCDICFTHLKGDDRVEAKYITPDMLSPRDFDAFLQYGFDEGNKHQSSRR